MSDLLTFNFRTDTESYKLIESSIQNLYDKYGSDVDFEILYRGFQKVNEDIVTDIKQKGYTLEKEVKKLDNDRIWTDNMEHHWLLVNKSNCPSIDIIKVYATPVDSTHLFDIYLGAISLLNESGNGFGSKASKYQRIDPLCFWVARKDFFRLEEYLNQFELKRALPFIPYRGNLGISRETMESYNGSIAKLMTLYFATKPSKVNLVDMYQLLINIMDKKNENISKKFSTYFTEFLKYPHTVTVLLKSMELIVNELEIKDDNILLWDSYELKHITDKLREEYR